MNLGIDIVVEEYVEKQIVVRLTQRGMSGGYTIDVAYITKEILQEVLGIKGSGEI